MALIETHGDDSEEMLVRRVGYIYEEDTLNVANVGELYGLALENDGHDGSNKLVVTIPPPKMNQSHSE